jgi:hypothetical protein
VPASVPAAISLPEAEASGGQAAEAADPAIERFDEVWRPGKRKEMHRVKGATRKPQRQHRERAAVSKREQRRPASHAKPERSKSVEHSPFAALAALKGRFTVRQPEGS